jgi:hypothetical protein
VNETDKKIKKKKKGQRAQRKMSERAGKICVKKTKCTHLCTERHTVYRSRGALAPLEAQHITV